MKKTTMSTVLSCLGAIGVIGTSILAAKAGSKAERVIRESEFEKGEKLSKFELAKTLAPVYAPTIISGISTISCIFGADVLNKRAQASIMSAYMMLDRSYKEYRQKVNDLYGDDADAKVQKEMAKVYYPEDEIVLPKGERLFFDFRTLNYFTSTIEEVLQPTVMEDGLECYIIVTPFDEPLNNVGYL